MEENRLEARRGEYIRWNPIECWHFWNFDWCTKDVILFFSSKQLLTDILLDDKNFPFLLLKTMIEVLVPPGTGLGNEKNSTAPSPNPKQAQLWAKGASVIQFGRHWKGLFSNSLSSSWNFPVWDSFLCIYQSPRSFRHSLLKTYTPGRDNILEPFTFISPVETKAGGRHFFFFWEISIWKREELALIRGGRVHFCGFYDSKEKFLLWRNWSPSPQVPGSLLPPLKSAAVSAFTYLLPEAQANEDYWIYMGWTSYRKQNRFSLAVAC